MASITEKIDQIPDPIQQAIFMVVKWLWEQYGKDIAMEYLAILARSVGMSAPNVGKWLDDLWALIKVSNELDWKQYIIVDNVCDPCLDCDPK